MKFNGKNVQVSAKAKLGKNVRIGDNTIIYDYVEIGDNVTISNDCVIGEPLNDFYSNESYQNPGTVIGDNSLIRSHTIIYAGCEFGSGFSCGHRVTIREYTKTGKHFSVGTLSDIQGFVTFGDYCRLHSNVHIGQTSKIGNFVFIYPYVVLTNDPHPPSNICNGPTIGDYTQIAVHSVILPGVQVGSNCLIAANSTVGKDFGNEVLIGGSPAKVLGPIGIIQSKEVENTPHYPWMYRFERGMPWENIGYEEWLLNQTKKHD